MRMAVAGEMSRTTVLGAVSVSIRRGAPAAAGSDKTAPARPWPSPIGFLAPGFCSAKLSACASCTAVTGRAGAVAECSCRPEAAACSALLLWGGISGGDLTRRVSNRLTRACRECCRPDGRGRVRRRRRRRGPKPPAGPGGARRPLLFRAAWFRTELMRVCATPERASVLGNSHPHESRPRCLELYRPTQFDNSFLYNICTLPFLQSRRLSGSIDHPSPQSVASHTPPSSRL